MKSATTAQERLSLPSAPTHRMEFEIRNNPAIEQGRVAPAFGQLGKGFEKFTSDPVEVRINNIQSLKP